MTVWLCEEVVNTTVLSSTENPDIIGLLSSILVMVIDKLAVDWLPPLSVTVTVSVTLLFPQLKSL